MSIEEILYNYLKDKFHPIPIYTEMPNKLPKRFYIFYKTGTFNENMLTNATFTFQSYGESLIEVIHMNEVLKKVMENMKYELEEVGSVELNSDYNLTDTQRKKQRYQAIYQIYY